MRRDAQREKNVAVSRQLAANATLNLPVNPELSILLAVEAVNRSRTEQAEDALRQSLIETNVRAVMRGHTAGVASAVYSSDGRYVATASDDGTARLWEAESGSPVAEFRGHTAGVSTVAFSKDGELLVTAGDDNTARV